MQKKAYSYIRFSSAIQEKGDSLRRQIDASRAYAKEHNLLLDESLKDIGVSAYTGENATEGALKKFIELVEDDKIEKGSILIIESLDRLSRQAVLITLSLFTSILSKGVEIVTLSDNQHYTIDSINETGQLMFSLMSMSRSHQESDMKSKRGKSAWDEKRRKALEEKKPLTRQAPRWLSVDKNLTKFTVNDERVEIIKYIFELSIGGKGQRNIARTLNKKKIEPFTKGKMWNSAYIASLIKNKHVIGIYQPKHKGVPVGEPIENYYPQIIDEDIFYQAQAATRLRLSPQNGGRKGVAFGNIFTKMCKCENCGTSYKFIQGNGTSYLTCRKNDSGGNCKSDVRWRYKRIEQPLLVQLSLKEGWAKSIDNSKSQKELCADSITVLKEKIHNAKKSRDGCEKLFDKNQSQFVIDKLASSIEEHDYLVSELKKKEDELNSFHQIVEAEEMLGKILLKLKNTKDREELYNIRERVNLLLRQTGVMLYFDKNEIKYTSFNKKTKSLLFTKQDNPMELFASSLYAGVAIKRIEHL